jgi:anti-sigma-K factor RskA
MPPPTPLWAHARTRGELIALGVDAAPDASLDELIAQVQARITQAATISPEFFDRALLDELTRCWRMLSAATVSVEDHASPVGIAMPAYPARAQ